VRDTSSGLTVEALVQQWRTPLGYTPSYARFMKVLRHLGLSNRQAVTEDGQAKLKMGSTLLPGYIELVWASSELTRFGCGVTFYYNVNADRPTREAIEAAFIELLAGALPSGAR
jgi:hypothetical protein